MGKEPHHNVGIVCDAHAPKTGRYKDKRPESLVGHHVKIGLPDKSGRLEHLWVIVTSLTPEGKLAGHLDNDPVLDIGCKCGDLIIIGSINDIEDVL